MHQFDFLECVCVRCSNLRKGPQFFARFLSHFFVKANLDGKGVSGSLIFFSVHGLV